MEVAISPGNMYQVIFMKKLEIVNGIFSGSDFVEATFSETTHVPMWKKSDHISYLTNLQLLKALL